MNAYRLQRLPSAEQHAAATGYLGARYPWESALDGTEQIPPPVSLFTEGLYEQHVTADIALAQWQYFLATGDKKWLAQFGWPVLSQAAAFWASRVSAGPDGTFGINGVTGPDEENPDVNDEVYTDVAAKTTLEDAAQAAQALGRAEPADWARIASGIAVPVSGASGVMQEFNGYAGQLVKQADVTLLEYPWAFPSSTRVDQGNLNYYAPRTDPSGPSMSDSVNSIDTAALKTPGCSGYVFTQRSVDPFMRDSFDQFSETKTGGAFTFMTGIGGFLQEFLYGYSGFRWSANAVDLAPSLTGQLSGIVLHGLGWHGRRFTVAIGSQTTTISLNSGNVLPIRTDSGTRTISAGQSLTVATQRPDLAPTRDLVRCGKASATSSAPGAPPLAAIDGSPVTGWQPAAVPSTLTASMPGGPQSVSAATLQWGQEWPSAPTPTQPPPPGPVSTLRAISYSVAVSLDGRSWQTVGSVMGRMTGSTDVLHFRPARARYVAVHLIEATDQHAAILDELSVTG